VAFLNRDPAGPPQPAELLVRPRRAGSTATVPASALARSAFG
jgi:hypothetical protein